MIDKYIVTHLDGEVLSIFAAPDLFLCAGGIDAQEDVFYVAFSSAH
jgi:hypothetical protein